MHCLTIDLEDWFHFLDNEETQSVASWGKYEGRLEQMSGPLLDFLDRHEQKATFFVLGWIAERYPQIVQEVANRGHEIACHSYAHPLIYNMTPDEFKADLLAALDAIEAACGLRASAYRAPGFSITQESLWAFDILRENGITMDSSVFPAARAHGGLSAAPATPFILETDFGELRELPISRTIIYGKNYVFSGGGYFRITPDWMLRQIFKKADARREYFMTYFHPRDFFADQPIPELSPLRRFKAKVGLTRTFAKLEHLFELVPFGPLGEYAASQDWSAAKRVSVRELSVN